MGRERTDEMNAKPTYIEAFVDRVKNIVSPEKKGGLGSGLAEKAKQDIKSQSTKTEKALKDSGAW